VTEFDPMVIPSQSGSMVFVGLAEGVAVGDVLFDAI